MPRKKTIQPAPDMEFPLDDGTIVEIRGPGTFIIGRGRHMQDKHQEYRDKILDHIAEIYLSPSGRKNVAEKDDILKSASTFDRAMQTTPLYPMSGDDSSMRKRVYPYVKEQIEIFAKCIERAKKTQ